MNTFTLIINAGRSGSTFLKNLLSRNFSQNRYIAHEDIPVQVSKPRLHNRAYTEEAGRSVLSDSELTSYLEKWERILEGRSIIETGWTSCHLAPVLLKRFGKAFRFAILHRDPVSFAFSRANMGNYHPHSFYDDAHEVSPYDPRSIASEYSNRWEKMNHFEKCMFWWYVVYKEAYEFKEKNPNVPCLVFSSNELFKLTRMDEILRFLELESKNLCEKDVPQNELPQFVRESFPLDDEWRSFEKHPAILKFAEGLGYSFNPEEVEKQSLKYQLPEGFGALIRNKIGFWRVISQLAQPLKRIRKNQYPLSRLK